MNLIWPTGLNWSISQTGWWPSWVHFSWRKIPYFSRLLPTGLILLFADSFPMNGSSNPSNYSNIRRYPFTCQKSDIQFQDDAMMLYFENHFYTTNLKTIALINVHIFFHIISGVHRQLWVLIRPECNWEWTTITTINVHMIMWLVINPQLFVA